MIDLSSRTICLVLKTCIKFHVFSPTSNAHSFIFSKPKVTNRIDFNSNDYRSAREHRNARFCVQNIDITIKSRIEVRFYNCIAIVLFYKIPTNEGPRKMQIGYNQL